jgi:hypothetical protein
VLAFIFDFAAKFWGSLSTHSGARRSSHENQPRRNEEKEERTEKNLRALRFFVVDFRSRTGGERIGKRV